MANINSVITYNANLSPAQAQIKALTGQIAGLSAAFNTLDKAALSAQKSLASGFAANVGQIGGFTAQTVKATDAVTTFGKQLVANRLTMREYFREAITGYTRQQSMLRQLAAQQVRYQQSIAVPTGAGQAMLLTPQSIDAMASKTALASQRFSIFNELINKGSTQMLNWGKNTQWAGRQLMVGFTLPLALFTATLSKQFRDLDKELTRFQKVYGSDLGGAITESTARMREQVKQLAYDISQTYGIAAKDTAALAADIAATGAEGEQLMSSVQQTTRLAVLGEVDRQEAMKATLALQSAFKMNTNELAESINFLNAVENQTSATLEDLATAIPKVGPVIRSLGGDVRDLATLLVAMREGGIPAAEAANALKSGLASLINPTKQASEVAQKFGIDLVGIVEANKGQLMPTIYAMRNALSGLDDFARSRVIEQIFGKYQFARISALFDNIGRTGSQTQSVIELASKSSTELAAVANQEIKTLTESTAVKFQRTLEQLKNALMPIGQVLTESLIPILDIAGRVMETFSTFFSSLPDSVKGLAKWAVGLTALAGPAIMLVGLFANLTANGLKFGMSIVRLGARMTGLKIERFELLDDQVMAAKLGVDNLTSSFTTQETALKRLTGVLSTYEASLRRLTTANPALFIPGAIPGRGGSVPIKRQSGSYRPEFVPGSGRGDKIPAMLEPGEFIVNRKAAEKYAPVLLEMNRGTLQGFVEGTQGNSVSLTGGQSRILAPYTVLAPDPYGAGGFGMSREFFQSSDDLELTIRASAITAKGIEDGLRLSRKTIDRLSIELEPTTTQITDALRLTATEMADAGQEATHISQVIERATPRIDAILSNLPESTQTSVRKILSPTMQQVESGGYYRVPSADIDPQTGQPTRTTIRSDRRGQAGSFYSRVKNVASKIGLDRTGMVQAHLTPENYSLLGPVMPFSGRGAGLSPELRAEAEQYIERKSQEIIDAFEQGLVESLETRSPSKKMDRDMRRPGKDFGDGAVQGFVKGYKSSAAGKPIIAGPVGGGGIESISNAQKIAQADQSILKYKTLQAKFTSDRVIAEQQIANINAEIHKVEQQQLRGEISFVEMMQRRNALYAERAAFQNDLDTAEEKEKVYQDKINEQKQKILTAETAQARSEEEEAKKAASRAAASMVAPGGIYGTGGYAHFATVGRAPKPEDVQSAPGQSLTDVMEELDLEKNDQDTKKKGRMGGLASGGTNALLGLSMLTSTMTMFSGASSDAANKVMMLSTAVMTLTMAAQAFSGMGLMGAAATGVSKVGGGMKNLGSALAPAGRHAAPGLLSRGLMGVGGALAGGGAAAAGTVAAVAIPLIITAAGFYMYKKSLDEAKEKANAAFAEPAKTAEFFGKTVDGLGNALDNIQAAGASKELSSINSELRMAVSEDYAGLIEKLKTSVTTVGAADLGSAYTKMIVSGMSAEEAQDAIKAIAAEAGYKGGVAYVSAFSNGLLEAKTIEEAYQQTIGKISPESVAGQQAAASEAMRQQAIANPGLYGRGTPQVARGNFKNVLAGGPEFVQALKSSIEISQTAPELVAQNLDKIRESYLALNEDAGDIFGMGTSAREMAFDEFKNMMGELDDPVINELLDDLQNSTAETQSLAIQMTALGIPLTEAKNAAGQFDAALAQAAISNATRMATLEKAVTDAKEALVDFAESATIESQLNNIENAVERTQEKLQDYTKSREEEREGLEESFELEQKGREDALEAMQDEMDARKEIFDEEMDQLDEKSKKIRESSDTYIESLQKNQRADSFYAQQRKTSLSALQKLASGDVFGFLQEREQMSQDAQDYSYDQMIGGIEERRDLELDAIDETREKKQKEQEEYEKMMKKRIDLLQEEMDIQSEIHEQNMKDFDEITQTEEEELQKRLNNRTSKNEKAKDLIDGIKKGEVESYKEVTKVFGEQTAKRYEELVKAELAALQLKLQAQVAVGDLELGDAERQLMDIYNALVGAAGYVGPEASRRGAITTYAGLQDAIGLPGFTPPPPIPGRAGGGKISGPGGPKSDVIPAMLSNGEYVIQASSVSKYGTQLMDEINAGRFADGGLAAPDKGLFGILSKIPGKEKSPTPGATGMPGTGEFGQPTVPQSTSTNLIGHPSQGGPNKWPYSGYPQASAPVPGANVSAHLNKDVLPLFLAFASDYNRLIRPINTLYGIGSRDGNYSNHPSGTAIDINPREEGQYFGWGQSLDQRNAVLDWWRGKPSSLAPWESKSPIPYVTMNALMDKYKILQWFGPRSLGGFIIDELGNSDPMHVQITQSRTVSPGEVAQTIASLGINPDGTFNAPNTYASGGFISGPGGPRSDVIPAMLSNGEYVVKADSVSKYGVDTLNKINKGEFDKNALQFADGGVATARSTRTVMGGRSGPNGWPWIEYYGSNLLETKRIPGTRVSLTMNKDVLPLFLALASDYNKLIRKIGPNTWSYDPRLNMSESDRAKSNHPSGTAMDINSDEEGANTYSEALFDWWKKGKTSPEAPWEPISPKPFKTALSLKDKYQIVDWFGPTSLGGSISGEAPDYMHWQISQSGGIVTPQKVARVIKGLGITPDGTFERPDTYRAAGGFISGPGGPRSDIIPALLSNGEYVVKAASVSKYGKGMLDQINAGQFGMGGAVSSIKPRMISPMKYADGGFVGAMSGAAMPTFGMPEVNNISPSEFNSSMNNFGGSTNSSTSSNSNVKVIINGASGKSAKAIANRVISIINEANGRRNHSRSI